LIVSVLCYSARVLANEIDASKLPAPAARTIDFARDVKPILENHCLKCHSDEKPKSNLRLTTREAALKGGAHGVDIIPGQSAKSPLISYVARLDEEMAMPPEGRGTPLTQEEIALLRSWIDQGVVWEPAANEPGTQVTFAPTQGWTTVSGNREKFRELYWQREGWNGGLENLEIVQRPSSDSKLTIQGHILLDDYKLRLSAEKDNLGFADFGWTQFRKYFDDTGGYYPLFSPPLFELNRDLHLDVGRAWTDFGLTLPQWPRLVFGYEYQYRNGTESTLQWGPVTSGAETRSIYPAFKELSEKIHILKFDTDYELAGVALSDSFRGEWYRLSTHEVNESSYTLGGPGMAFTTADEKQTYFQGANTFHLEKQFADWLFASGGYLYSKLDSDGSLEVETLNPAFLGPTAAAPGWDAHPIELQRESHVFSLSSLVGPWEGVSLTAGVQNEWTRQTGLQTAIVNVALPFAPFIFPLDTPQTGRSDLDRSVFSQEVGVRFTKIPYTTLFADARFQQDDIGDYEEELNGLTPFLRDTDAKSELKDFRVGFNSSPWQRVSLSGQFRRYDNETDYNNLIKQSPTTGASFKGYPAFIRHRDLLSDDAQTKLALQLTPWLKTSLNYEWLGNRYHTRTEPINIDPSTGLPANISPGTGLLAGTYNSHIAGINATLTPFRRLFLSTTFAWQNARTITDANGTLAVQPYEGNIYSVIASGNYALNERTDLITSYSFSTANFAQNNLATGLPLGINYQQHGVEAGLRRRLSKSASVGLQYRFFRYEEPSSNGANNFDAHAVFATFFCRLP